MNAAVVAGGLFALASPSLAEDSHREHGAHEHGSGALGVVLVGSDLSLELRMPGVNVVGFEHAPESDADREAVAQALAVFRDASQLYVPNAAADCSVVSGEASLGPPGSDNDSDHDEHAGKDDHDKHAAKGDHADHDEHTDKEAHAELVALSRFECASPERLQHIEVKAFAHLRDVEDLDAQVITEQSQGEVELSPDQPVLPIGGT